MSQVTWRAPDELVERLRQVASGEGRSLNEYLTRLVRAAVDPDTAEDGLERIRERLARAGVLAPAGVPHVRPDADAVAEARRAAGRGTPLSDLVSDGRR
ncbi:transcriptional regulator [Pseudonocardia nematodicida]|uniref:Transcriptional regulator n=1 Tax=Pseudonocardia nematodicida TaxID=1206997 RepID=A0ABV1KH56_9PSEU